MYEKRVVQYGSPSLFMLSDKPYNPQSEALKVVFGAFGTFGK